MDKTEGILPLNRLMDSVSFGPYCGIVNLFGASFHTKTTMFMLPKGRYYTQTAVNLFYMTFTTRPARYTFRYVDGQNGRNTPSK